MMMRNRAAGVVERAAATAAARPVVAALVPILLSLWCTVLSCSLQQLLMSVSPSALCGGIRCPRHTGNPFSSLFTDDLLHAADQSCWKSKHRLLKQIRHSSQRAKRGTDGQWPPPLRQRAARAADSAHGPLSSSPHVPSAPPLVPLSVRLCSLCLFFSPLWGG